MPKSQPEHQIIVDNASQVDPGSPVLSEGEIVDSQDNQGSPVLGRSDYKIDDSQENLGSPELFSSGHALGNLQENPGSSEHSESSEDSSSQEESESDNEIEPIDQIINAALKQLGDTLKAQRTSELESLYKELNRQRQLIDIKHTQLEEQQAVIATQMLTINRLGGQQQALQEQNQKLKHVATSLNMEVDKLKNQLQAEAQNNHQFRDILQQQKQQEIETYNNTIRQLELELQQLKQTKINNQAEIKHIQAQLQPQTQLKTKLTQTTRALSRQKEVNRIQAEEITKLKRQLAAAKTTQSDTSAAPAITFNPFLNLQWNSSQRKAAKRKPEPRRFSVNDYGEDPADPIVSSSDEEESPAYSSKRRKLK